MNDNSEGFDKLLDGLGTPPLFTVVRVNTLKTTVHDARQQLQKILEEVCCKKRIIIIEIVGGGGILQNLCVSFEFPPSVNLLTV